MKFEHSPFPSGWWAISLENVGLQDQRPDVGTYGCYEHGNLPPLPVSLSGRFQWLLDLPLLDFHVGTERLTQNQLALKKLVETCESTDIALPHAFIEFFSNLGWQARIRSNTDCFLDLASEPVRSPIGPGKLVRFLADSQGCVFWYLYIPDGSAEHAVVSSPDLYDTELRVSVEEDQPDPSAIVFAEETFEAFLCRFTIENELWFSKYGGTPISQIGQEYLERYRASATDKLGNQF